MIPEELKYTEEHEWVLRTGEAELYTEIPPEAAEVLVR